jgi:predicted dehydrogenase
MVDIQSPFLDSKLTDIPVIDLANDKDVDLVVCSVRVDRHFQPVKASIIARKAVFVEWPLERNLAVAREMAALAAQHNAPTIVGLQGSFSPEIRKLKEVIESGRIGRVVSSSWEASFGNGGRTESKNVRYFLEREVGGNVISIGVGHSLEFINYGMFAGICMNGCGLADEKRYSAG